MSPFCDTLTGREAPPLLALRRITDHHLEALRAGKTGTAGALTGPAAGSYHTVAHGSFCPLLRCGCFGARQVRPFQNLNRAVPLPVFLSLFRDKANQPSNEATVPARGAILRHHRRTGQTKRQVVETALKELARSLQCNE